VARHGVSRAFASRIRKMRNEKSVLILLQYLKMAQWLWVAVVDMKCGSAWRFDHAV